MPYAPWAQDFGTEINLLPSQVVLHEFPWLQDGDPSELE